MKTELNGGKIFREGAFIKNDGLTASNNYDQRGVIELGNSFILPAFCDVHVHLREPGFSYKETIAAGTRAAARGGYTTLLAMPNVNPVPDDLPTLNQQLEIIKRDAIVNVVPYGAITKLRTGRGELSDMAAMEPYVCAYSDDGTGVQDQGLMLEAMRIVKELGVPIVAHCEDEELLRQGKIRESEWRQIERDIKLAEQAGCKYHVCHISCKESVELIRDAKKSGVDVSCETAPHYLLLDSEMVNRAIVANPQDGGRYKMNPPIKDPDDMDALISAVIDGTIDMVATDHAPHSAQEKSLGYSDSLNGISGLECAFPVLYTGLVTTGIISMYRLLELLAFAPRERFELEEFNSYIAVDLDEEYEIDASRFVSHGRCTPFDGYKVCGKVKLTVCNGSIVYAE